MIKSKIIITILTLTTIGTTGYALIENHHYKVANKTITQYNKERKTQENDYKKLLSKISNLEKRLDNVDKKIYTEDTNDEEISSLNKAIDSINSNISKNKTNIKDIYSILQQKQDKDQSLVGKWKYTYTQTDNNGTPNEINTYYQFTEDGKVLVDDKEIGTLYGNCFLNNNFANIIVENTGDKIIILSHLIGLNHTRILTLNKMN